MNRSFAFFIAITEALAVAGCSSAPNVAATAPVAAAPIVEDVPAPVADPSITLGAFLQAVDQSNALEITLGKMAIAKADAEAVKDFGQPMATNHTAINVIIGTIAKADGRTTGRANGSRTTSTGRDDRGAVPALCHLGSSKIRARLVSTTDQRWDERTAHRFTKQIARRCNRRPSACPHTSDPPCESDLRF